MILLKIWTEVFLLWESPTVGRISKSLVSISSYQWFPLHQMTELKSTPIFPNALHRYCSHLRTHLIMGAQLDWWGRGGYWSWADDSDPGLGTAPPENHTHPPSAPEGRYILSGPPGINHLASLGLYFFFCKMGMTIMGSCEDQMRHHTQACFVNSQVLCWCTASLLILPWGCKRHCNPSLLKRLTMETK